MKTYKLQELQGRYFATIPVELVKTLGLNKGDKLNFKLSETVTEIIISKDPVQEVKEEVPSAIQAPPIV